MSRSHHHTHTHTHELPGRRNRNVWRVEQEQENKSPAYAAEELQQLLAKVDEADAEVLVAAFRGGGACEDRCARRY